MENEIEIITYTVTFLTVPNIYSAILTLITGQPMLTVIFIQQQLPTKLILP